MDFVSRIPDIPCAVCSLGSHRDYRFYRFVSKLARALSFMDKKCITSFWYFIYAITQTPKIQ